MALRAGRRAKPPDGQRGRQLDLVRDHRLGDGTLVGHQAGDARQSSRQDHVQEIAGWPALDSFADLKLRRDAANFKGKTKASRDSKKKAKTTPGLDDDEIKPDLARRARSHCTVFLCVLLLVWKLTSFFRSPSHQPPARRLALPPRELSELRPHLRHPPPRRRQAPLLHLQRDELWRQCLRLGQRAPLGGVALVDRLELVRRLHREDVLSSSCSSLHLQPPPTLVNSLVSAYPDITDASPPPSLHPAFRSYP